MVPDENPDRFPPRARLVDGEGAPASRGGEAINHVRREPERVWCYVLGAAVFGALLGWLAGEKMAPYLPWKDRAPAAVENGRDRLEARGVFEVQNEAETRIAVVGMGFLGAALGLSLGTGGGLARRSNPLAASAGGTGLLLGAAVGSAVPWILVPVFYRSVRQPPDLALPLIFHTCMYSAIGGVAGLALGVGLKGRAGAGKGFVAGALGASLGSLVFNILHTVMFPLEWDFSPMPGQTTSRVVAHLCVALAAAVSVVSVLSVEGGAAADRPAAADRGE